MGAIGMMGVLPVLMYSAYSVIPLAAVVYLFLKWRAYRDGAEADPRLGAKVVFHYFKTLAYQVLLIGLVLVSFGGLKSEYGGELKTGLGFFLAGGLVYALFFSQRGRLPGSVQVVRVFAGFNLVVAGILAMVSLVAGCIILFTGSLSDLRLPVAGLVVYGAAALCQAAGFFGFPKIGKRSGT